MVSRDEPTMARNVAFVRQCYPTARLVALPDSMRIKAAFTREDGDFDWLLGAGPTEVLAWADAAKELVKDGW